ncbi:MAG TPA: DEAD/DEAH box helicase [Candidatus Atribacteria bacterium]|nr:DEAD/DEAH box helicase [Candidatus Atribacteria bacterium]
MRLKFDPNLQFQIDAVNAMAEVFYGQPLSEGDLEIGFKRLDWIFQTELGIGNNLILDEAALLKNIHLVQEHNDLEKVSSFQGRHFSIEMETGTGKTYVYLRTIFELYKKYGFKKFVIVVPSVAIREGVLKNLEITKEHFLHLYNNVSYDYFVYDSKKINQVRQFAASNHIQIMVINIDAFRKTLEDKDEEKKSNIIHRESDKLSGRKPIEFIQATHPIVIIDEPQSVDNTPKAKEAMETLNPLCTMRYSATHRNPYNLLYKLDPIKAYDMRLVKRIEVASVLSEEYFNQPFIQFKAVDNQNGIRAKLSIHVDSSSGPKLKNVTVRSGDDLFVRSNERENYRNSYIINEINAEPGNEYISFANGKTLALGQTQGGLTDDIMKIQVKNAIQEHLEKELKVKDKGIKVLSLFFIDRVANYRSYDEQGNPVKGKIALWFEEYFNELIQKPRYKDLLKFPLEKLHDGYFAADKKGILKDTSGTTLADEDVYNKIMKNKEQLLSLDEPLRFIFSHSALREGWDNPNVFQICTLNETKSEMKKRQEIGRGLRLPVNQQGERIFDETINRLTVIANESYEDFARKLQTEIEEDFNVHFGAVSKNAFAKIIQVIDDQETTLGDEKSKKIWEELKQQGHIDEDGKIQPKFNPSDKYFEVILSPEFQDVKHQVIDIVQSYLFSEHVVNRNNRKTLKINKMVYLDDEFKKLWDKIKPKTTYSVEYDTDVLIEKASKAIREMDRIEKVKIVYKKAEVDIQEKGIVTKELRIQETTASYGEDKVNLPDILAYLQKETELTRNTIVRILISSGRIEEFPLNPQKFMDSVARLIKNELHQLVVDGIKYEKIAGQEYEMRLFEETEIISYLNNLIEVKKSVYDAIEYDSEIEKRFAESLDMRDDIKLFVKLPSWFKIDTPIGTYNPDWAIVKHEDDTLYLIRETKGIKDFEKLRNIEADKIRCAKMHFRELKVDFKMVVEANEV